uniref:Secreted protein n=1 Tax=Oryza sativa subsp. japonica TaxID=39947 RepID=Q2QV84_ORYSJ|nr:hypothetical protein LOC_Os12g13690 [Oryza sativa Japonica Group]
MAKGVGVAKPLLLQPLTLCLIGTMAKGKACGETSSPVALDAVPYWHYGEGQGLAKPLRPQPLTPCLIGTMAKGVGVAKPLRPQPLTPCLIGTMAKGVGGRNLFALSP